MLDGLIGRELARNKPSQNVFVPILYSNDPFIENVVLFLKGNGENNSTNIIDSSANPKTITRFGDTKISTAQNKYGGSSIYFDGNGDYLRIPGIDFSNSNFTIETWGFFESISSGVILDSRPMGVTGNYFTFNVDTSKIGFYVQNGYLLQSNVNINPNLWNHVAVARETNTFRLFINGALVSSATNSLSFINQQLFLGASQYHNPPDFFLQAYLDSFRVTLGVARYTANFNPETDTKLDE